MRGELFEAGFYGILGKPLSVRELGQLFRALNGEGQINKEIGQRSASTDIFRGYEVLLVEDHVVNQKVALRFLKRLGLGVTIAENGVEAIEAVRKKEFSVVFMDWKMPVMDGLAASREIRALGAGFKDLPIIAMTANSMAGDRDQCLEAGMNDYISKPITPDKLVLVLNRWLLVSNS